MQNFREKNLDAALAYAKVGLPVIPLHSIDNGNCTCCQDCKSAGKHPRIKEWLSKASINEDVIKGWWFDWPNSNVGIVTGRASNLLVVDVDPRHGGDKSLVDLEAEFGSMPATLRCTTGGGGAHYYFDLPDVEIKNRVNFRPGLDVRAEGGFIVATPSTHISGKDYAWCQKFSLEKLAKVPQWLLNEILKPAAKPHFNSTIGEGQRNTFLTSQAGYLLKRGLRGNDLLKELLNINSARVSPPLEFNEVARIASNVSRYQPSQPIVQWLSAPKELPQKTFALPELKESMIPEILKPWVLDITDRMQVVPEFVMVPAIASMAAVIGRQLGIYPKKHDDWFTVPNLWGAIVARPGSLKSPTIAEAFAPLESLIKKAVEAHSEQKAEISVAEETLLFELEEKKEQLKKALKAKDNEKIASIKQEVVQIQESINAGSAKEKRYKTNDATVEKIAHLLRDNPNGLLLFRDELAGWIRNLEKAGREGDREFYLEAWNGYGSYTVDRVGTGTIHVPALCMSVFGGIQPSKLADYIKRCQTGVGDDGMLQRFQLLVYPEESRNWRNIDRLPNKEAKEAVIDLFHWLDNVRELGSAEEDDDIPGVRFSNGAQEIFNEWRTRLEVRLRSGEIDNPAFESHLAKFRSLVPSLALIFWLCEVFGTGPQNGVSASALRMAIQWADFLEQHAKKIYFSESQADSSSAHCLAAKIKAGKVEDKATLRAICRNHWANLGTKEQVEDALEVLEQLGWLRVSEGDSRSPVSRRINLHPSFCK